MQARRQSPTRTVGRPIRWFQRLIALIAVADLGLVLFDLSYVPWRDLYIQPVVIEGRTLVPKFFLTRFYDPIKGIEPHRDTQRYLATVDQLQTQLAQTGPQGSGVENLLQSLRDQSAALIQENPFELAGKTGTLEKIKNRLRDRVGNESATRSFETFWSRAYLEQVGWPQALSFFNQRIRPPLETNYWRVTGENGQFVDDFWRIDLFFIGIFGLEFLARSFYLSRRHRGTSWLGAMVWRWYDLPMLLPFWRWLRVLPVVIRLNQAKLINLDSLWTQFNRLVAANLAVEMTELVVVRLLNQAQNAIEQGEISRWLLRPETRRYIDIDGVDNVEMISTLLLEVFVHRVLPKIQPDLEALLRHTIHHALSQSPVYQGVQRLPGLNQLPDQITAQLVSSLTQTTYNTLAASLKKDPVGSELFNQLVQHASDSLRTELGATNALPEIQTLLSGLLEEVKLNYFQKSTNNGNLNQELEEEAEELRHLAYERERQKLNPGN